MRRFNFLILALSLIFFAMPRAEASSIREIDTVLVTWPGAPLPKASLSDVQKNIEEEVSVSWKRFTETLGSKADASITFKYGKSPEPISINRPMSCDGAQSVSFMNQIRAETYRRLGLEDWSKRYLVILVPEAGCIWQGRATLGSSNSFGGVLTLHDTASSFVIMHELGHTLGLGHTNFFRCTSGAKDGPWGSDCKAVEYGGVIDVMGNVSTNSPLSTYHQWRLGLINNSEVVQSWRSETIELSASDTAGKVRAIFLRDGDSTYWIEYRRSRDGVSGYQSGLVIYRTDPPTPSLIVSPNPEDSQSESFGLGVGTDIWMLNLDSYRYLNGRASGSMTLPKTSTFKLFSGNISISATSNLDESAATVKLERAVDFNPPPTPRIVPSNAWQSGESEILFPGFDDKETTVASFEIRTDTTISAIPGSDSPTWAPTFRNPLVAPKTLQVKDLPEGAYSLAVRSIDFEGNRSSWSAPENVFIDRAFPIVESRFKPIGISGTNLRLKWSGASDSGTGLCETTISNSNDFIHYRDRAKQEPEFLIPLREKIQGKASVTDCSGNTITAPIQIKSDFKSVIESRRTGKWREVMLSGSSGMKCEGRCSASFSTLGNISLITGQGSPDILVASKKVFTVPQSSSLTPRVVYTTELGKARKVLRVTGTNFTLFGLISHEVTLGATTKEMSSQRVEDVSLKDPNQSRLANYGFLPEDFLPKWTVLPMARGTTLLDPTLDLCEYEYNSENNRKYRRQVVATAPGSTYTFLSTEVVDYGNLTNSDFALNELRLNLTNCIRDKGGIGRTGIKVDYDFSEIPVNGLSLVSESNRVLVRATIGTGSLARQLLGFYQFSGQYFVGLYVVRQGPLTFSDLEAFEWAKVAEALAKRFSR
jgi:hypothetical protein